MKKTLIALAALAATSAFAQSSVTLTGKLRFAYGEAKAANGDKTTGIGVTDGDWNIAAVEDLGGGLKAGANMALRLRGRDAATDGASTGAGARPRDSSMFVSVPEFGTVTVGAIEAGNGLLPLVTAGGPNYIGLDNGTQLAAASNTDILSYTSPVVLGGFTVRLAMLDNVGAGGAQGAALTQDANLVGLTYASGNLQAAVDFTTYGANSAGGTLADSRTRVSANYNFNGLRLGGGYQTAKTVTGVTKNETAISVSSQFPGIDALNVGLIYATSKTDGVDGSNSGYDVAAQYALSKRTYVAFQAQRAKAAGVESASTNMRVQLAHSF